MPRSVEERLSPLKFKPPLLILEGMDQLLQRWRCPGLSQVHIKNLGSNLLHDVYSSLPFTNSFDILCILPRQSHSLTSLWLHIVANVNQ